MFGAISYSLLEIIWRGFTHWSMFVLGGLCFLLVSQVAVSCCGRLPLWFCCVVNTLLITERSIYYNKICLRKLCDLPAGFSCACDMCKSKARHFFFSSSEGIKRSEGAPKCCKTASACSI